MHSKGIFILIPNVVESIDFLFHSPIQKHSWYVHQALHEIIHGQQPLFPLFIRQDILFINKNLYCGSVWLGSKSPAAITLQKLRQSCQSKFETDYGKVFVMVNWKMWLRKIARVQNWCFGWGLVCFYLFYLWIIERKIFFSEHWKKELFFDIARFLYLWDISSIWHFYCS